jgi:mannose-6-phosphate isomerase-like protein (cupin superfamily)
MDPLSDVLSLLTPRSYVSAGFDAGGDWSIQFSDQHGRIKCYAVVSGACWLSVEDVGDPVRLKAGDCAYLDATQNHRLNNPGTTPAQVLCVFAGDGVA